MSELLKDLVCGSRPRIVDTGEQSGWIYGMHHIYTMPADNKCPRCGASLDHPSTPSPTQSHAPVDEEYHS